MHILANGVRLSPYLTWGQEAKNEEAEATRQKRGFRRVVVTLSYTCDYLWERMCVREVRDVCVFKLKQSQLKLVKLQLELHSLVMVSMLLRELAASTPLPMVVISTLRTVCKKAKTKQTTLKAVGIFF